MNDQLNLKELLSQIKKRFYRALIIPMLTLLLVCYIFSVNRNLSKIIAFVALFALIRGVYVFYLYIKQMRAYNRLVTTSAILDQQVSAASDRVTKILISTAITLPEEPLNLHPASEALFRHINEKRLDDPMIGIKLGSEEINQVLIENLTNDRGVHIESLLVILGSLAGFACRASVAPLKSHSGEWLSKGEMVHTIEGNNGQVYFAGDSINKPLLENEYSVWGLAAAGAQQSGVQKLPDVVEIIKYVTTTYGTENFGLPRYPNPENKISETPEEIVKRLWPILFPKVYSFCKPAHEWPLLFGLSLQKVIIMGKDAIDPEKALKLAMECAVPMSKINPALVST